MARIFQKYVTEEGRSTVPPEIDNLRQVSSGPTEVEPSDPSGDSIKLSDMVGESPKGEDEVDSAISMYILMKGMRNMMQYMMKMAKGMQFNQS